jgi:hypothetical protein
MSPKSESRVRDEDRGWKMEDRRRAEGEEMKRETKNVKAEGRESPGIRMGG